MKKTATIVSLIATIILSACNVEKFPDDITDGKAVIHISTSPMTIIGEQVPYCSSRANSPLPPEYENPIYSIAILVFDVREGVLRNFTDISGQKKLYKFINLTDENGNGLLSTTLPTGDLPVLPDTEYTICVIANLTEIQIEEMIASMMDDGTVFLDEFKNYKLQIPYVITPGEGDDEKLLPGHVRDIYMFGYFQGNVSSHKEISISLGRIISRLEISLSFNEANLQKGKSLYVQLENLEKYMYLYPTGKSPGIYLQQEIYQTRTLDGLANSTIYLYSGPNSATDESKALCLKMWYLPSNMPTEEVGKTEPNAIVHLCNDRPETENRNYQLNRNSVYRFNIRLI